LKKYVSVLAFVFLFAVPSFAQQFGFGADSAPKASIEGSLHKRTGDDVEGTVTATILDGWHVNSNKPTEEFAIPTELMLDADNVEVSYPAHQMKAFEFTNGSQIAVYDGKVQFPFRAKLKPGATSLTATLKYQPCSNKVCLPPNQATATIDINKISAAADVGRASARPGAFTPLSAAPKNAAKSSLFSTDVGGTFASRGLPLTLLAIFILGLALNLTPCVYPRSGTSRSSPARARDGAWRSPRCTSSASPSRTPPWACSPRCPASCSARGCSNRRC
jgi:thioredoxin:protein disulfide reductase